MTSTVRNHPDGAARSNVLARLLVRTEARVLGLWLVLAFALSLVTGRAKDWFSMTDEMRYERLAMSIARSHSLVPRVHDQLIDNWAQLYPLLISPAFHHAYAPADVHTAHLINAFVMSSACIPTFLLTRRVLGREWAAYLAGALSVAVPWILYATMLMTEVATYPVVAWAMFAMQRSIASPARRSDLLALLAIGLAYVSRTALGTLLVVLPLAILVFEVRRRSSWRAALRKHDLLVGAYAVLALVAVVVRATGHQSLVYGMYSGYSAHAHFLSTAYIGSFAEHYATFALALGVLPVLFAAAWVVSAVIRPPETADRHAFACLAAVAFLIIPAQVTDFDVAYTTYVHDRFMIYLVPLVLVGCFCAILDTRRLRWSIGVPVVVLVAGYAFGAIPEFTWRTFGALDPDTPASSLYRPLADLTDGLDGTRVLLAALTAVLAAALLLAPRVPLRIFAVGYMVVVLPLATWGVFHRYFDEPGWSSRPITAEAHGSLDWIDTTVGANAQASMVPFPVSSDWFASEQAWRDVEFWNRSVTRDVHAAGGNSFEYTGIWFPKLHVRFDPRTGAAPESPTRYVVQSANETRFRVAGPAIQHDPSGVMFLIDAAQPWRLDWKSAGLYDDGWTRPHQQARIRVYSSPGQKGAVTRTLIVGLRSPDDVDRRSVRIGSNLESADTAVTPTTAQRQIEVCVPMGRYADVTLATPESSQIAGDLGSLNATRTSRGGGVHVSYVSLSDDVGPACEPRR